MADMNSLRSQLAAAAKEQAAPLIKRFDDAIAEAERAADALRALGFVVEIKPPTAWTKAPLSATTLTVTIPAINAEYGR